MLEIKENQELNVVNVLSYRGKVRQAELENVGKEMESYIQNVGAKRVGNPTTATYAVEGDTIDIELLMPIDKSIDSTDKFVYKKQIKIVNAVVACYKGHPMGLQEACNQLNQYIMERKLQPITVGYNVTKKTDMLSPEDTEIDVYVGISPNIL
ncbi:MAG: AraC family transcriptional regulator [Lachnospiraceae bacterium]|nr:AraC family transcriptional regulator [Lachnospiraceae bacterium]